MKNPYILTVIMKLPTLLGLKNHSQKRGFNFINKVLTALFLMFLGFQNLSAQSFSSSNLDFNGNGGVSQGTSLMFGPDGRLYVAQNGGNIDVFTIQRNGVDDYVVTASEEVLLVKNIPNHNDDGSSNAGNNREVTGITVSGTANNPIMYVTSSDSRVGGPSGDQNLDTNSGVITRLTWSGSQWIAVDIVRGLPRSEENHATNGLEFVTIDGVDFLIVAQGGHANAGSPSDNFAWTTEYALSAALLSINLTMLEAMPILSDGSRQYIYDLPTLDDPTRANVGPTDPDAIGYTGVDVNDPFGGNDGLNQAMVVPGGPVQIFSAGYRNSYDLVVTEAGKVFATDNGANGGWGGFPENEGLLDGLGNSLVTNNYIPGEPGSTGVADGEQVNNKDHLTMVTDNIQSYAFGSFYGGHPTPVRANPAGAGLYTNPTANGTAGAVFRTLIYDPDGSTPGSTTDASIGLPANWPPVPVSMADPQQGDWRGPGLNNPDGPNDILVTILANNTNGIDEYTASNFGGAMQTNLIAGKGSSIWRVELDAAGNLTNLTQNFKTNLGNNALGITCNSDSDPFPGTIWIASYDTNIRILEPNDFVIVCLLPGDAGYQANGDNDFDGYTNQDEIESGSDPCGGGEPEDFDKAAGGTLVSDFNDLDDDNDGINDAVDSFQLGDPLTSGNDAFDLPVLNELLSGNTTLLGYLGLGFTGLMNNGDANPNWLDWIDVVDAGPNPNDILGGAVGAMTIQMTPGTALGVQNNQEKAFQFGVNIGPSTGGVTVEGRMFNFAAPLQLYGSSAPANGEIGLFIGDGTQSNYIKFVLKQSGLEARQEINDVPQPPVSLPILQGDRPDSVVLFFVVNPASDEVTLQYQFDGGSIQTLSSTITTEGAILAAIQDNNIPLAVGLIGSSNTLGQEVEGTWDYINVQGSQPTIQQDLPDLSELLGTSPTSFPLDNYFSDDGGAGNLTYSVVTNTNPAIGASVSGNTLNITFPASAAESNITIRATDSGNLFVEQTFTVTVSDEPTPLIRIRANGATITATDAPNPNWVGITAVGAQSGTFNGIDYAVNTGTHSTQNTSGRDASVPSYVPQAIYTNERYDVAAQPEMEFTFDLPAGDYLVRLYMGNGYGGTDQIGERVFDISMEGQLVQDDLDLVATFGHQVGGMIQYPVTVNDGTLNILFGHDTENPLVNGIEILGAGGSFDPPISVNPIANQTSVEGNLINITVLASGGNSNENFAYSAINLPTGIQIEPSTGLIFGTISSGASTYSPYNATITVDKPSSDPVSINITWNVSDSNAPNTVLYRVNTGGALTASNDSSIIAWEEDQKATGVPGGNAVNGTPSQYVNSTTLDLTFGAVLPGAFVNTTGYPDALFATERYNNLPEPDNMQWSFPTGNGNFRVNLLFNENWANENANANNYRIFDVEIEGQNVLDDYRPSVDGTEINIAKVETFLVNVTDGDLNIDFIQFNENPAIKGIEILSAQPSVSQTWTAQNDDENHTARHECSFVQAGDKFYLFGGRENPANLDVYDYQAKTWSTITASAPSDFNHFQAVEYNGLIWVIGAFKDNAFPNEVPADFVWAYNPATDNWVQGPAVPTTRKRGSAGLVVYNDKFYVIAGNTDGHDGGFIPWFDEFDPATGVWTTLTDVPKARDHFHAGVIGDKLYVAGGRQSGGPGGTFNPLIAEVDVYDFTAGAWSTLPSTQNIPTPRAAASVAVYQNELYVIGGEIEDDLQGNTVNDAVKTTESFNPSTGNWTSRADLITERHGTQAIVSGDGIHLTAGSNTKGGGGKMKNMEFLGNDNPSGTTLVAGILTVPTDVSIAAGSTETVALTHSSGNTGIIITSVQLGGTDASEFMISSNSGFSLLNPGETTEVTIVHMGTAEGKTASLIVGYDDGSVISSSVVSGEPATTVLYRINAGGGLITDVVGDFEEDQRASGTGGTAVIGTPSPYLNISPPAVDKTYGAATALVENNTGYPDTVFQTERYSDAENPDNMQWSFPTGDGVYQVNLLFNENWANEDNVVANNRIFDVQIENQLVLEDYRPSGDGSDVNIAKVESFQVNVTDGTLNINFLKGNQNPAIKGIEILSVTPTMGEVPIVTNPGAQVAVEGDVINLPIVAIDGTSPACGPLTYSAENLPGDLTIDESTGLISGTLLSGTGSGTDGAFIEENGIVVIEMESAKSLPGSWTNAAGSTSPNINSPGSATGGDFIVWEGSQFLNSQGNSTISYPVEITTTGTYRFQWRTQVGNGTSATDHNDTWLKIEGDSFYGQKGGNGTIICPKGSNSSNDCTGNVPQGAGGNGWLKVYSSGSTNWTWSTFTSDNDGHQIFARFDTPGTYNVLISVRSSSHALDRMVLSHVNEFSGNPQSTSLAESQQAVGVVNGASADSPYDVTVTVTDACTPTVSTDVNFTWNVTATETNNPAAIVQVNPGMTLDASTYNANSFLITNIGEEEIVNIQIDLSTGFMKDVVFDPVGTAGDSVARCLLTGSGGNSATAVGLTVPGNNGTGQGDPDCTDVFDKFHNGIDVEEGYDILTMNFTDFNPGESYNFGVDIDPTTIKGDITSGDAGSVSGFELIGATVRIEFASGAVYATSLFDEGSIGGSDAIVDIVSNAIIAPSILVDGLNTSRLVTDANQLIEINGTPNASVTLLRVDGRLYLDQGNPSVGYDIDLFEANEAMAKQLYQVVLDANGIAIVPVILTQTPGTTGTPDGGLNHFISVVNGPNGENSIASNVIVLEFNPNAIIGPSVLIQMTPDADLDTSTYTAGSLQITNNSSGGLQITDVTIDLSTAILPDMIFDPSGTGGDATAKCFEANTGADLVGLKVPADICTTPFSQPRQGGYDIMSIGFNQFDPGESFTFSVDIDPNSIQDLAGAGAAGSVSGFELVGATVTITFNDASTITTSIYEDGSLGGGQAIAALQAPVAPIISVVGVSTSSVTVNDLNQTVTVTGTPGDVVSLMLMDSRLFIATGNPAFNVPDETYYANEAMDKILYTGLIGAGGTVNIPVVLLQTAFGNDTPEGGLNQIVAVTSKSAYAPDIQVSSTSNVVTLLYDPNTTTADITITAKLQARDNHSGDYTVKLYEVGSAIPLYDLSATADESGLIMVNNIAFGTYELALKYSNSLQVVQTITIEAPTYSIDMGELLMGNTNVIDNVVSQVDFAILSSLLNLSQVDPGYNPNADFNGDGFITLADFAVLLSNFNVEGQKPSGVEE
jgi:N-acetylneuraminic acid mutarotase